MSSCGESPDVTAPVPGMAGEHEALLQFLYLAPVGLVQTRLDGEIEIINATSAALLMPLSRDGSLANLFTALAGVAPDLAHLTASFQGSHGLVCEAMHLQVSAGVRGRVDPRILSLTLLKLDDSRMMAVLSDVSVQVKRERLLRQNEAWLDAVITGISDYALVSLDADGRIDDWNASIGRVTGFGRDAIGQPYSIFYPEGATTPDRIVDRLREAEADGWSIDDGWRLRADGSRFWGSALIDPLRVRDGVPCREEGAVGATDEQGYCLVIRDITDKREVAESYRRAVSCDHLTGIGNRRAFYDAAELELERWKRAPRELALIAFDADNFKAVNDSHGHAAGDAVLRHLAGVLGATFRQIDVVARIGGEEFAVLLPSTGRQGAMAVAERFRETIAAARVVVGDAVIRYTVSGGVTMMTPDVTGLDMLLKRADEALYAAKAAGRNRIEYLAPATLAEAA